MTAEKSLHSFENNVHLEKTTTRYFTDEMYAPTVGKTVGRKEAGMLWEKFLLPPHSICARSDI
jgi:hypothetical protein